jgi:hypothetical protein
MPADFRASAVGGLFGQIRKSVIGCENSMDMDVAITSTTEAHTDRI